MRAIAVIVGIAGAAHGQGGPPLLTDDTGTPGDGAWELNVAVTMEKTSREDFWEAPILDLNYGIGDRVQLKFEIPWAVLDEDDAETRSGFGNPLIGVKWRFLDQADHGVSVSTYPQIELNALSSSVRHGLAEEDTGLLLPIEIERDFGYVGVGAEVGFTTGEERDDGWVYGLALGKEMTPAFELVGELHGESGVDLDDSQLVYDVGFRWQLGEGEALLFSIGQGLRDRDDPDLMAYLGLQTIF